MTMNAGMAPMAPMGRYILPQFEERTSYGMKRLDPYTKMFEDRIIFLGVLVDDASADDIIAQLIVLESQDPDRDILMYINSPGGSFTAMTAIYDTMQYIRPDIQTFVVGQAASAAAVLLGAGAPGKRYALPNARILIHQPALAGGDYGQASDIEIQANEVLRMRTWLEETLALHTGRADGPRHRARQDPQLGRGQGVRPHRRGSPLAQGLRTEVTYAPVCRPLTQARGIPVSFVRPQRTIADAGWIRACNEERNRRGAGSVGLGPDRIGRSRQQEDPDGARG